MVFAVFSAPGQRIKATATLDSTQILLGDQVNLKLSLEKPATLQIDFAQVPDTLAGKIEVLKRSQIDTTTLDNQFLKLEQTFLVTCFDSGTYRIPPFKFDIRLTDRNDSVFTNELFMKVFTMEIDTTKGPADIKMPYDAPLTLKEVTPYILGIILAGAIFFLLLYSIKRKKKNLPLFVKLSKPKEPAHITALRELDRIKEEKLWQKDKIKEYYSELTEVLRIYIEDRFSIPAMEQTTYEIISSFSDRPGLISEKSMNHLGRILPLADLVKFAKYKPLPDDHNLALINAYFFVNETKIEEQQKPEKPVSEEGNGQEVTLK
jgi:hypothetical protein